MGILSTVSDKVIDITSTIVLVVAMHVPFLYSALMYTPPPAPIHRAPPAKPVPVFPVSTDDRTGSGILSAKVEVVERYLAFGLKTRTIVEIASSTDRLETVQLSSPIWYPLSEDGAILIAQGLGFTTRLDAPASSRFSVKEAPAQNTGTSTAWFISGTDYHASTSFCPKQGGDWQYKIGLSMEINKWTGKTYIEAQCQSFIQ